MCMLGKCYSKYGRNIGIDVTMVHIYLGDRVEGCITRGNQVAFEESRT